ncbi:cyclopropane-fatty-acyl-phospholipid synthase family protein [Bacteriovorax sp. Seq25_V]|uniref:SAM-dependent methyltransferase n=1 Tax=Bacteriovorax sp. Seq25_V TaxID=1201288 RepID=UPI00038A1785|nr:cyclopropane-fatty-acyl-phospholipid synthase family protein [Bacteriovorax sp. Seq25_V]EQC43247.1 cyclopropane-fatty-acyl-phospholipid synthase [Bacteriovorax sp. Seq25_V]
MEQVIKANERFLDRLYKKLIISTLSNIKKGRLIINYGGHTYEFGTSGTPIVVNVSSPKFFRRLVLSGEVGLGESYMEGEWETPALEKFLTLLIENQSYLGDSSAAKEAGRVVGLNVLGFINKIEHAFNHNSIENSKKNISYHYDLSNQFYQLMLDKTMTYSSALFKDKSSTLEEAQMLKYLNIASMLKVEEGEKVLEIGSGWGGMSRFLSQNYGAHVETYTISKNQYSFVQELIERENIENVKVNFKDYREPKGLFNKIVSIEMIEAVGEKYLETYFSEVANSLEKNGRFAMQAILMPSSRYENYKKSSDWIEKYIFPGGHLPSVERLVSCASKFGLELVEFEEFGLSYAETLRRWYNNFHVNLEEVTKLGFDERFIRMWTYYLKICEAAFETRNIYLAQFCFTRPNN